MSPQARSSCSAVRSRSRDPLHAEPAHHRQPEHRDGRTSPGRQRRLEAGNRVAPRRAVRQAGRSREAVPDQGPRSPHRGFAAHAPVAGPAGQKRYSTEIVAQNMRFVGGRGGTGRRWRRLRPRPGTTSVRAGRRRHRRDGRLRRRAERRRHPVLSYTLRGPAHAESHGEAPARTARETHRGRQASTGTRTNECKPGPHQPRQKAGKNSSANEQMARCLVKTRPSDAFPDPALGAGSGRQTNAGWSNAAARPRRTRSFRAGEQRPCRPGQRSRDSNDRLRL